MIDVLWSEFFVILVIALIFLGPKEMLMMLKTFGVWFGKAQRLMHHIRLAAEYEAHQDAQKNKKPDPIRNQESTGS